MSEQPPYSESELIDYLRAIDVPAPQELHRKIEALVAERAPTNRGRRSAIGWQLAGGLALAVVVAALVVSLAGGGGTARLSMRQALALTLSPATAPAPAESAHNGTQLAAAVDNVAFPYWDERFGWRSSGARSDHAAGRAVTTVFYTNAHGQRIGYAIVAGTPAPAMRGGVVQWRGGIAFRVQVVDGSRIVSWQRNGHLCVVAGRGVSSATLLRLASWQTRTTVSS